MPKHQRHQVWAGFQEGTIAVDADDTPRRSTSSYQLIRNVPRMCIHSVTIGVRENHWPTDMFDHLHRISPAGMGTARNHSYAQHLIEYFTAEGREPAVFISTTSANRVVEIVGHQHPSNT